MTTEQLRRAADAAVVSADVQAALSKPAKAREYTAVAALLRAAAEHAHDPDPDQTLQAATRRGVQEPPVSMQ